MAKHEDLWIIFLSKENKFLTHPRGGLTTIDEAYGWHYKKDALEQVKNLPSAVVKRRSQFRN